MIKTLISFSVSPIYEASVPVFIGHNVSSVAVLDALFKNHSLEPGIRKS